MGSSGSRDEKWVEMGNVMLAGDTLHMWYDGGAPLAYLGRVAILAILAFATAAASAQAPEFTEARGWFEQFLPPAAGAASRLPFSFTYDGRPSGEWLSA
jgi:hypothetical protein